MTLKEALSSARPGTVISLGNKASTNMDFIEIFVMSNMGLRFSDPTMIIDDKMLGSDEWDLSGDNNVI